MPTGGVSTTIEGPIDNNLLSVNTEDSSVVLSHNTIESRQVVLTKNAQSLITEQGGLSWKEITEERIVPDAVNIYVSKNYSSNRPKTETANWPAPPGWAIFTAEVNATENFKGRGSYTQKTYAQGQTFDLSNTRLEEQKEKLRLAIDAAFKDKKFDLVAELQSDYSRLEQLEQHFKSSHNWLEVTATASAGRFARSRIRVVARVTIFRVL